MSVGLWLAAAAPVATLLAAVLFGRLSARVGAALAVGVVLVMAATVFHAGPRVLAVGLGKGLWLAFWVLLVVWPGLLLYRLVSAVGSDRVGAALAHVLPDRCDRLLALAWVLPSFIQGVAGFGTPIAVSAPLLVALGWSKARAVAYPLIGYHWAVTFGSMGSSFYVASLTGGLSGDAQTELALRAGTLLGINCVVAGALILLLDGGVARLREGLRTLLLAGPVMAGVLVGVAALVPAVATLAAGGAGFATMWALGAARRRRSTHGLPALAGGAVDAPPRSALLLLCPYALLMLTALPVFLIPATRRWADAHLLVAPDFPATVTGRGWHNAAVSDFNALAVLAHPGFFIALSCLLGHAVYRRAGLLEGGQARPLVAAWARGLPSASLPILLLTSLAMLMVDAGMISVLARGTADVAGAAYPAFAPVLGALGSFMTGSTTSSNALFAGFQSEISRLIDVDPTILVAGQTAGGNVGNSLSPVVILVGAAAVDAADRVGDVLRLCLRPAAVLLLVVVAGTLVMQVR